MKQKIIANTIMFIMILLFIVFFKGIFGEANKMVGIVVLIIGLVISERDLTQNLKLLTVGLLIVNILIGVLSYVTLLNPFIGLILNLI
ncbi:MAG: FUSC family protein, partial [Turicibacter sp.]|nr:FUSC family protein [Turicibacter sp.]